MHASICVEVTSIFSRVRKNSKRIFLYFLLIIDHNCLLQLLGVEMFNICYIMHINQTL